MSKKFYIRLGDVCASCKETVGTEAGFWEFVDKMCVVLKDANPLFDEIRFREYIKGRIEGATHE